MSGALAAQPGRAAAIRRVFLGLLAANLAVVGAKVVIGVRADSLSVLGDAVHSSMDALNNVLFMALTRVAARGPDEDHPYGHAKFEVLGAVGILIFLSVACFELLKGALAGLVRGAPPPAFTGTDLTLLAATLAVSVWVSWYEGRRGRALESDLLLADAAHTRVDVYITAGVLLGAALSRRGVPWADPVIAIVVTGLIARMGWGIVRRAMPALVDEAARDPGAVRRAAEDVAGVEAAYDIRSRAAAGTGFAELTIRVRGDISVAQGHAIADAVEARLRRDLRLGAVVVHVEPC